MRLLEQTKEDAYKMSAQNIEKSKNAFLHFACDVFMNQQEDAQQAVAESIKGFPNDSEKQFELLKMRFDNIASAATGTSELSGRSWIDETLYVSPKAKTKMIVFELSEEYTHFSELGDEYPKSIYTDVARLELSLNDDDEKVLERLKGFWKNNENPLNVIFDKEASNN